MSRKMEVKEKLSRLILSLIALFIVIMIGYIALSLINYAFNIAIPGTVLSGGLAVSIIILAVVTFLFFEIISDLSFFMGLDSNTLSKIFPGMHSGHVSALRKIVYNIFYVVIITFVFWIITPFLPDIPGVGKLMSAALPFVILAIVVLLFWDIGRTIYGELDLFTRKLTDRLLNSDEQEEKT